MEVINDYSTKDSRSLFINGLFAFAFGPNRHEGKLGIARFGGHIEANESIVECALREVKEETTLDVLLVSSPITYQIDSWDSRLMEVEDEGKEVKPIFEIWTERNVFCSIQS